MLLKVLSICYYLRVRTVVVTCESAYDQQKIEGQLYFRTILIICFEQGQPKRTYINDQNAAILKLNILWFLSKAVLMCWVTE